MNVHFKRIIITVWILLCVFSTVDTGLFVYPVMSQFMLGGALALLLVIMAFSYMAYAKTTCLSGISSFVLFAWWLYICVHSVFAPQVEEYRLVYLSTGILLMFSLAVMLRDGLLSASHLRSGCLLMLVLHIICLLAQASGLMRSSNTFFPLTGFNDNPNATAMLIAVCVPMLCDRLKTSRRVSLLLVSLTLSVVFLFVLRCRTAFVGLAVIIVVRLLSSRGLLTVWTDRSRGAKTVIAAVLLLLLSFALFGMYSVKKDSSEGRLLIWRISADMMVKNPEGCGVGMFQREYNVMQGKYFADGKHSADECKSADIVFMAYNDYLEHGTEAGLVGMFFMMTFYLALMVSSYRQREYGALASVTAFAVMSMVNFVYTSVQTWCVMICYAAYVMSVERRVTCGRFFRVVCLSVLAFGSVVCVFVHVRHTYAQIRLKTVRKYCADDAGMSVRLLSELSPYIGTSEAYWSALADAYMKEDEYGEALECLDKASVYAMNPSVLFRSFVCCDKMDETEEGARYLRCLCDMMPHNLTARYVLMKLYVKFGDDDKALRYATEILTIPVKVRNEKSDAVMNEARRYIYELSTNK